MDEDDEGARAPDVAKKWGLRVAERGFAQLPNYLLFLNQFVDEDYKLSPIELLVLVQLSAAWWRKGALPFPSMATLAVRCGVSERQIQRAVTKLEANGLLRRVKRRSAGIIASNAYDLSPLVTVLENVARAYPNAFPRRIEAGSSARLFETPVALSETKALAAPDRPKVRRLKLHRVKPKPPEGDT